MATQTKTQAEKNTDQATKRIRDLNEQILDFGRNAGTGFLEAYEKNLQTFADYQDKVADQTKVDWVASLARAQANFTREISRVYTSTARDVLK
jgi:polyhydroxyalkanoate synthesis regulator protein